MSIFISISMVKHQVGFGHKSFLHRCRYRLALSYVKGKRIINPLLVASRRYHQFENEVAEEPVNYVIGVVIAWQFLK